MSRPHPHRHLSSGEFCVIAVYPRQAPPPGLGTAVNHLLREGQRSWKKGGRPSYGNILTFLPAVSSGMKVSGREAATHRAAQLSHCCCYCAVHTGGWCLAPGEPPTKTPSPLCFLAVWEVRGQHRPVSCGGSQEGYWEGLDNISPNSP